MFRRLLILGFAMCTVGYCQTPLPAAQAGVAYKAQLGFPVKAGAVYPFKFSYTNLPAWLRSSAEAKPDAGRLAGIPGPSDVSDQPVTFMVSITDAQGNHLDPFSFSILVTSGTPEHVVIAGAGVQSQTPAAPSSAAASPGATPGPGAAAPPSSSAASQPAAGSQPSGAAATSNQANQQPVIVPPVLHEPVARGARSIAGTAESFAIVEMMRGHDPKVLRTIADPNGHFQINIPAADSPLHAAEDLEIRQIKGGNASDFLRKTVVPYYRNGEELRAILGYQQAGASAAKFDQNWFVDFYISRPLSFLRKENDTGPSMFRWWGNVRVASFPQQGDIPIATFASNFVQQFGQLRVNQLVQSAEFLTGFEVKLLSGRFPFLGKSEETRQRFTLGLFGGGGATGPLDPASSLRIFETPGPTSPQRPVFDQRFPGITSKFIGFASPDRDNFLRQYLVGLKLTTTYMGKESRAPLISAPAMLALALGQNEVVTGGKLQGVVLRTEAFYPLPFFNREQDRKGALAALYLFGTAQMHLGKSHNFTPLILNPRPDITGSDPNVTIVTSPSNRDIYRIGFGMDLVHAIMSLTHPPGTPSPPQ